MVRFVLICIDSFEKMVYYQVIIIDSQTKFQKKFHPHFSDGDIVSHIYRAEQEALHGYVCFLCSQHNGRNCGKTVTTLKKQQD